MNEKYNINWHKYFVYDETSPTKLRWKHKRLGRGGKPVARKNNGVAGCLSKKGTVTLNFNKDNISVKNIIWVMFKGYSENIGEILFLDSNPSNVSISNLYEFKAVTDYKYGEYLSEYLVYDETSPSCLRWIKKWNIGSTINVGDVAGSLDARDGYWKLHAFGRNLKLHKVVWALNNDFQSQEDFMIDHFDGNRSNNRIKNLRLISPEYNSRNQKIRYNSKTEMNGVSYYDGVSKTNNVVKKYTATVYIDGKRKSKSFSAIKYGDELAFLCTCEWRDKMIRLLNAHGYGYTERHGL